jgi:KaiC/GvpD/RAD55 family RecA-like ATPase
MNEEKTNGIPLPGQEDARPQKPDFLISDNWFDYDITPYRLDFKKAYEAPRYTLSWNGIPFAPLGGIHAITGQAGNGKTMTLAQFMAAILSGEFGNLRYELKDEIERPTVLYIDTEMEEANTIAVKNRVMTLCGRSINDQADDFIIVMLREVPETVNDKNEKISSSVNRWRMTLKAIYEYKPTAVFIDGLLDVVKDFNDNKECQDTIYKCMQVASHYGISVWCIVHQNPGGEKLVGHLGSFLERKVTDIFQTKKEKNDKTGDVTFNVKQLKARGRDVGDWKFRVMPVDSWGRPEQIDDVSIRENFKHTAEEIKEWIETYQDKVKWPASLTDIRLKIFKDMCGIGANDDLQQCVTIATNRTFLIKQPEHEFDANQKKPKYYMNPEIMNIKEPF